MTSQLNPALIDPRFVQIQRKQAAEILGVSPAEFDRLRKKDEKCPKGHTRGEDKFSRVYFRLSDIYAYSEALMSKTVPGSEGAVPPNSK